MPPLDFKGALDLVGALLAYAVGAAVVLVLVLALAFFAYGGLTHRRGEEKER